MTRRWIMVGAALVVAVGLPLAAAGPAAAEPATTVSYRSNAAAIWYTGQGFDTCSAPSIATMQAWNASPYRAIGVYIGGPNRACAQPNLTASWVSTLAQMSWRMLPIYLGLQAPCTDAVGKTKITPSQATAQGTASAADAAAAARALGMLSGSPLYADMENYLATDTACRTAVLQYLSAWTKEVHRQGFLSGVYANLSSGALHLSQFYNSTSYARPDVLWMARWDGSSSLSGWAGISNSQWSVHQRMKQYRGDHNETYGGVTLSIDNDQVDAPVATTTYGYTVTSTTPLSARKGPGTGYSVVRTLAPGSTAVLVCQTAGTKVGNTTVWDKLSDGSYVTDLYISTPSATGYSPPVPGCRYPYQVTVSSLNRRSAPSASASVVGTLAAGALGWIRCQTSGSKVGTTSVWDRLADSSYVTDLYVATPSKTTYSAPAARC